MTSSNRPLTPEESDFAAEHHNLVGRFLRRFYLPEDDWYDVAIFGYLRAVKLWITRPDIRCWAFSTIAFRYMFSAVGQNRTTTARRIRKAAMVSADAPISDDGSLVLGDMFKSVADVADTVEARMLAEIVCQTLNENELHVHDLYAAGYTYFEIGEALGISKSRVGQQMKRIRQRYLEAGA